MMKDGVPPGFDDESWEKLSPEVKALIVGITEAVKVEVSSIHTRINYLTETLVTLGDRVSMLGDRVSTLESHQGATAANGMDLILHSRNAVESLQDAQKKLTLYLIREEAKRSILAPVLPTENDREREEQIQNITDSQEDELEDLASLFG